MAFRVRLFNTAPVLDRRRVAVFVSRLFLLRGVLIES